MTDTRDDDVAAVVRAAGELPHDEFRVELRARLAAMASGDVELSSRSPRRRTSWWQFAAAAAVVVLLIGAIALVAHRDEPGNSEALADQLVGSTWLALGPDPAGTLTFTRAGDGELDLAGFTGCNSVSGRIRLVDGEVVGAVGSTTAGCREALAPYERARLTIESGVLVVTWEGMVSRYVRADSLERAATIDLDGAWSAYGEAIMVSGGVVVHPAPGGTDQLAPVRSYLAADDVVVLIGLDVAFIGLDGTYVRLDRAAEVPTPSTSVPVLPTSLADAIVGRTWVGVDGPWRTVAPTVTFDSLDREQGLLGVSKDDGCNEASGTFHIDDTVVTESEVVGTAVGCEHEVAYVTPGATITEDGGILTMTSGSISTTYVALDALEQVADAVLDGTWLVHGATVTVDGDTVLSSDESTGLGGMIANARLADPVEVWRYRDGWIVRGDSGYVQLRPVTG